jgi:hypothetical protein
MTLNVKKRLMQTFESLGLFEGLSQQGLLDQQQILGMFSCY